LTKSGNKNILEKSIPEGVQPWGLLEMVYMVHVDEQKLT